MTGIDYVYVFLQSNLIEVGIYFLFYRMSLGFGRTLTLTTLSNSLTHPVVFFGFMKSGMSYLEATLLAELFAVVAESGLHSYFGNISLKRTSVASLTANLISWQLAPLITYVLFFVL